MCSTPNPEAAITAVLALPSRFPDGSGGARQALRAFMWKLKEWGGRRHSVDVTGRWVAVLTLDGVAREISTGVGGCGVPMGRPQVPDLGSSASPA